MKRAFQSQTCIHFRQVWHNQAECPSKKRHRGSIENSPSVQNPSDGQSRSPEVTFLKANQKEKWEKPDNTMRQSEQAAATEL